MNRLAGEKSPYLLQHAGNPVDWYPWGEEAFGRARSGDRPIFLSIGYSTCHWCHVMERESFESEDVAALLNDSFVSIKVDREERPDVDRVYMTACQMMTGTGGWPLTIFMTPEGKPFYAATYLPRRSIYGRQGLVETLGRVRDLWRERRGDIDSSADAVARALGGPAPSRPAAAIDGAFLGRASSVFASLYDDAHGGFGSVPKFPSAHNLLFLLRRWKLAGDEKAGTMAMETLRRMRMGGIYDQIGYGFHRYSTDEIWMVPHFEKMLYDQAMLAMAYAEAYQASGDPLFASTAREIFEYVSRDLSAPEGCFYSAEDADSEGREGAFYLWTAGEIGEILGAADTGYAMRAYGATEEGNFAEEATGRSTGENILLFKSWPAEAERLASLRDKLFAARELRRRPFRDDKVLTDWNGLMIAALAVGASALDDDRYLGMAAGAASFIESRMLVNGDRLLHRYRGGEASVPAYLDDYAFFIWGLIELYQAGFDPGRLELALRLAASMLRLFDGGEGGLTFAPLDGERLIAGTVEYHDGAYPSGNSVAFYDLVRLSRITGDPSWEASARRIIDGAGEGPGKYPHGHGMLLAALQYGAGESCEVVLAGDEDDAGLREMVRSLRRHYLPHCSVLVRPGGEKGRVIRGIAPFTASMGSSDGGPAAYVCRGNRCHPPARDAGELLRLLGIKST
ncbi:MAG: thioredoxin domain-containing protein [Spirochaetes bacterium]|nr:thioredoxin domain-containing protein [Spirochaetota bacterium]